MVDVKVATIMSVYSGDNAAFFASALDSIIYQSLDEAIESRIYLAIDGSISEELQLAIERRKSFIYKIVENKDNRGLSAALNSLILELEDEEFVFRMDSDDVAHPRRFQTQLDFLLDHPDIDILGSDIVEFDHATGVERRVCFSRGGNNAVRKLSRGVPVAHPTVCFRRKVFDVVGGYPSSKSNEDIALWFSCAVSGLQFDNVPEPLLFFRVSEDFFRRRGIKKAFDEFSCYVVGIWRLQGVTWEYIFPILRFGLRISPRFIVKIFYESGIRKKMRC